MLLIPVLLAPFLVFLKLLKIFDLCTGALHCWKIPSFFSQNFEVKIIRKCNSDIEFCKLVFLFRFFRHHPSFFLIVNFILSFSFGFNNQLCNSSNTWIKFLLVCTACYFHGVSKLGSEKLRNVIPLFGKSKITLLNMRNFIPPMIGRNI